jgi:thiol-disulfide isomerase/thioredoxin
MNKKTILPVAFLCFLISSSVVGQSSRSMRERLDLIVSRQNEARERYAKELRQQTSPRARKAAADCYRAETRGNTEAVLGLVREDPRDPAVVAALGFVIRAAGRGPGEQSYRAIELLRGHECDPGMGELCGQIFHYGHVPAAEALIRDVLERHPDRYDRAQACYQLAVYKLLQAELVRRVRAHPTAIDEYVHERHKSATLRFVNDANPEALDKQAESLLERLVSEFADVPHFFDRRPLGAIAEGKLFALRHLSVGKVAPEILGTDVEGRAFSLSDYRGKVVVLTFSGNWCGPCVGMYPQERELVARMKGQPFALLSVNTDSDPESLKRSIASGEITWRCWWDGGTTGPITTRWGIQGFPSIFVLDRYGVIRFKDVRGDDLDRGVDKLVIEPGGKDGKR